MSFLFTLMRGWGDVVVGVSLGLPIIGITHPILAWSIDCPLLLLLLPLLACVHVGLLASGGSEAALRDHAEVSALLHGPRHCHQLGD